MNQHVIVLTQTLRLPQAIHYAHQVAEGRPMLVVGDPAAIPPDAKIPSEQVWSPSRERKDLSLSADASKTVVNKVQAWSRRGSTFGLSLERWVRGSEWRFRHVRRLLWLLRRTAESRPESADDALLATLHRIEESGPIAEIAVFDVFDLPVALGYARERGIPLVVR